MNVASSLHPPPPPPGPPSLLPASLANATSQRRGAISAKIKQPQQQQQQQNQHYSNHIIQHQHPLHDHASPGSSSSVNSSSQQININNDINNMNQVRQFAGAVSARRSSPTRLLSPGNKNSNKNHAASMSSSNNSSTGNSNSSSSSTVRRLSDTEVRAIFECLHSERPVPTHLKFQIVPVNSNGLKLSPPSYEFQGKFVFYILIPVVPFFNETSTTHIPLPFFSVPLVLFVHFLDGLYVLLRPAKKSRGKNQPADVPKAPAHLQHLVWENADQMPETCQWSLSGPQFPPPTAIQQRYCYPKGKAEYSSRIGGALWTMYGRDKKEDLDFRLLHGKFELLRYGLTRHVQPS
jgi:hypothetical protein